MLLGYQREQSRPKQVYVRWSISFSINDLGQVYLDADRDLKKYHETFRISINSFGRQIEPNL